LAFSSSASKIFPPYRLDPANQCLWKGETRISLVPKAFAVLEYLAEHAGRLVTQEELLHALWPETFVQPEVLRRYILEIRRSLEDEARKPRFVETLPKRGYRFIATVIDESSPPLAVSSELHLPTRLVGREEALEPLGTHLNAALRGQRQFIFVTGEAGIGKTSLVDTFHEQVTRNRRVRIARGQCVEGFGGKEAYYPVLEALGLLMHDPQGSSLVQTLSAQAPTWLIQFPSVIKQEQRERLRREILGATRERMVREICEALESFTADYGLILILEDLHLVDDSTLDLISALARRRAPAKLMLLATYRPGEVMFWRSSLKVLKQDLLMHRLCHEISLAPLTQQQIEQYLSVEFPDSGFGPSLATLIYRWSDGNPLFMVALLERLQRQGLIRRDGARWVLTVAPGEVNPDVPETLQQMLEVQLEQLTTAERRLLRAASIAGSRFSAWAVAAMTERLEAEVEQGCEELSAGQQFIRRAGLQEMPDGSVSAQYEFKHALYREVLFRQAPPTHRRQLHLRLAERMESLVIPADPSWPSEMAAHFEAGRDFARAVRYLMVTAGNAARRHAHSHSFELLQHALELLAQFPGEPDREREIEILEHMSDVLYAQGEMVESADMDQKVVELAAQGGYKVAQVNALTRMARALAFLDPERCVAVCDRAVEVSRTHDDPLLQARAEMLTTSWKIVTNGGRKEDTELCAAALDKVRRLSGELPAYHEILFAHVQCVQGDYGGACQTARAGIPKSIENDNLVVFLSAHSSLAHALLHLGNWGELLQVISTASGVAKKNGNTPWAGIFRAMLAWLHVQAGDFAGAREMAEDLLRTYPESAAQVRTMAIITSGFASLEREHDQALRCFTSVCEGEANSRFFLDWYWRIVARLGFSNAWLASGELGKAAREAERTLQSALSTADPALKALAWEMKARVAKAGQEWNAAADFLRYAGEALRNVEVPFAAWRVHATAAELHRALGNSEGTEYSLQCAAAIIRRLADSLPGGEPLRQALLDVAVARGILAPPCSQASS
jgi:DNA-binding winged helix-turn-helix (wHTH) protein/tetratricopeptide (TPR) repeat protein